MIYTLRARILYWLTIGGSLVLVLLITAAGR